MTDGIGAGSSPGLYSNASMVLWVSNSGPADSCGRDESDQLTPVFKFFYPSICSCFLPFFFHSVFESTIFSYLFFSFIYSDLTTPSFGGLNFTVNAGDYECPLALEFLDAERVSQGRGGERGAGPTFAVGHPPHPLRTYRDRDKTI